MARPGDQKSQRARVAKAGVWGTPCARCGQPILPGQAWDLDHVDELWIDGGAGRLLPSHASCNRRHGARVGNQRRAQRRERPMTTQQEITWWPAAAVQIDQARVNTWMATAAHDDVGTVVKLWPPLPGTDVTATIVDLCGQWQTQEVAINPRSPSATLLDPLKGEGVRLRTADGIGMAAAQGKFADLLNAGRLAIIGRPELTEAARLAEVRRTAGAYAIDVYAGVEPLTACQLAVWALTDDLDYDIMKSIL
jgi:hypothetical protein